MRAALLLLLLLVACLPTPADVEPAGTPKRLARLPTYEFVSRNVWNKSPWSRPTDLAIDLPVLVLIAIDGSACVVNGADWALAMPYAVYTCESGWRLWRPT